MPKVIVGLSGGVDSSVSAYLLKQQGYQVEGLFMKNWNQDDGTQLCTAARDFADAQAVCHRLGIRLHLMDFSAEYWEQVFTQFLAELRAGNTPNPDILCNKVIKFKAFLDHALALGADKIATGHYAQICSENNQVHLHKGEDDNKDQSYFLYTLNQHQLKHVLFPLGNWQKPKVRALAKEQGFSNAKKKDSTGICFIGERRFKTFLSQYLMPKPGEIITTDGRVLGQHDGLMFYTLGQRKGLGIGGLNGYEEKPWYVADKIKHSNQLVVVQGGNHPALFAQEVVLDDCHWIGKPPLASPLLCQAKTRYRQADQTCQLLWQTGKPARAQFSDPQRAPTPGQAMVFYQGSRCLGGGTIRAIVHSSCASSSARSLHTVCEG